MNALSIGNLLRLPSAVQTVRPESARALEDAWSRRRAELAGWQPSGGWLIDQRAPALRRASTPRQAVRQGTSD